MKIEKVHIKSDKKNVCEDYFVMKEQQGLFAVLDGATPLCDFANEQGLNGAVLASRIVGEAIKNAEEGDIQTLMSNANALLLKEMKKYWIDLSKKHERWSTCLAMIKMNGQQIDYGQIGDCMIFAVTKNGRLEVLSKDTVAGISERAKKHREEERQKGKNLPDEVFYQNRMNSLIYNRSFANKPNGYGVLNGDQAAENYFYIGSIKPEDYKGILLISDGLFPKDQNWENMINTIWKDGLVKYAMDLVEYEKKTSTHQDDKTGIFIRF
ncbi:protein phosphatase 2C domain-containing protein [Neobacillus kokaensis]|uniref:Serine/threonine protein phosphatase n=1 Tax=Neobacillus kokaensis TaxID=2759023 RepID=A0ABQ3N6G9_9BACI|nr:protein phosphatase 2C domain-containing protein [Neobacillus kokaensis]GHH99583.1 serine/threonine protein phosphatase [Neobacillus kokaensis]